MLEEESTLNDISLLNDQELAYFLRNAPRDKFLSKFTLYSYFSREKQSQIQEAIWKAFVNPKLGNAAKSAIRRLIHQCEISELYSIAEYTNNIDEKNLHALNKNELKKSAFIASFRKADIESMSLIYLIYNILKLCHLFPFDTDFISSLAHLEKNNPDLISESGEGVFQALLSKLSKDEIKKIIELAQKYKLLDVLELCQKYIPE